MAKGVNKEKRNPLRKPAAAEPSSVTTVEPAPRRGDLPTASPPRKNVLLLAASIVLLAVWMLALTYLALWG